MSPTTPPPVISEYVAAVNARQLDAAVACFAADALVHDESHDRVGSEAIREWIEETTKKYQHQTEILRTEMQDGKTVATGRVSGNFPGSPVELEYTFTVSAGKITHLSIG